MSKWVVGRQSEEAQRSARQTLRSKISNILHQARSRITVKAPTTTDAVRTTSQKNENSRLYERRYWVGRLEQLFDSRYGLRLNPVQDQYAPTPPSALVTQIQDENKAHPDVFVATGCRTIISYLDELHDHGVDPCAFERILELGVGLGRLIRHFFAFSAELVGCDITQSALQYTQETLGSRVYTHITNETPPLPFEADSFCFIYANSVFTHIRLPTSTAWIKELHRVVRPDGVVIVSVFDANQSLGHLSEWEFDQIERAGGYYEWGSEDVRARYAYMTDPRLRMEWGGHFEVLEIRKHFRDQSHLIMRKRSS